MKKILALIAVVFALASPSWATNYYVATTGNDTTGDGSSGAPWRTIQKSVESGSPVTAGDTVYVRDGTYTATSGGRTVLINGTGTPQGTSGNPVTIKAENCHAAKIVTPAVSGGSGIAVYVNRQYITIECFEIVADQLSGNQPAGTSIGGIFLESSAVGAVIKNNIVHDIGRQICSDSVFGFAAIFTRGASSQTITENVIYKVGRRYNGESSCVTTLNANDHAIYVEVANNTTVTRNISYDNARGYCLNVYKSGAVEGSAFQHVGLVFDHNVCDTPSGETRGPSGQVIYGQSHDGFRIRNNIFNRPENCAVKSFNPGTFTDVSFIGNRTSVNDTDFHCDPSPPTGITVGGTNIANASIGFSNADTANYTLAPGSASIDAGQDIGDAFIGAAPDPGVFEFSGVIRYKDATLALDCTNGDYSISRRNCTGTDGNAYNDFTSAIAPMAPGDTLYIRSGVHTDKIDLQAPNKTGLPGQYMTFAGYSGETVTLRHTDTTPYGAIKARGNRGYFIFENFIYDAVNQAVDSGWSIRDGNHHFIVRNVEMKNHRSSLLILNASDIILDNMYIHDSPSSCEPNDRIYGLYLSTGTRITIKNSRIYNQPGGGMQLYPGPITDLNVIDNELVENGWCSSTSFGGIVLSAASGNIVRPIIAGNVIHRSGYNNGVSGAGGPGHGIRTGTGGGFTVTGLKLNNNTIYDNQAGTGSAYGVYIQGVISGEMKNNLVVGNETGQILNQTTGAITASNNRTTGTITDCTVSTSDLRMKQGTNSCRDAGTSVTTRPSPVGVTDIGAYEHGDIASATVASNFIEVTVNVMTPSIQPTSGITAFTIANGTSTGTPVVTSAVLKAGSTNIVQLTLSGFTASGTCTISYGAGNLTDSGFIGPTTGVGVGVAQGVNSRTALAVSGTCNNTSGSAPPAGGLYSEFLLNDGSGTTATDTSGNANHGTVSAGVTWVNDTSGTGVTIPTDATYRHVASTYGAAVNPTSESISTCSLVLPDTQYSQKVVGSSGSNGTSQRAYYGWATVNGVQQWGIGVQASGFTSGVTEFPLQAQLTLVCMRFNAATDTANLSVNRTIGTSAAANKTYTSYTLVDDLRVGNDETFTTNNGGYIVYGMWVWNNTYLSNAEVQAFYDSLFPAGGSVGGYAEVTHRWQAVYLDGSLNPINFKSVGSQEIEVVAGGAVAIEFQVDCTGGDCGPLAVRLHASDIAGNTGSVPQELDAFGLAMWRADTSSILNRGVSSCCLSGALTEVDGVTILDSVASNTIELAEDSSTMFRFIVRVATDKVGELYTLSLKQDNGAALDGAAGTTPQIRVVALRAGMGGR